jgi:uncharacterized DUF497 family protein
MYDVQYEWDERKDLANQKKHGISFGFAARVFEDESRLVDLDRADEETTELRWHAVGRVPIQAGRDIVLLVVHVYRENNHGEEIIRIISARQADKQDVRRYQEQAHE